MATDKKKKKAAPKKAVAPKKTTTPPVDMAAAMQADETSAVTNTQEALSRLGVSSNNLPKAFIPARTVVDTTGTAVVVDINGRDEAGNTVKEAPARKPSGIAGVGSVNATVGIFFGEISSASLSLAHA